MSQHGVGIARNHCFSGLSQSLGNGNSLLSLLLTIVSFGGPIQRIAVFVGFDGILLVSFGLSFFSCQLHGLVPFGFDVAGTCGSGLEGGLTFSRT